jgi:hypothetical protein
MANGSNLTNDGPFLFTWDCENRPTMFTPIADPNPGRKNVSASTAFMMRWVAGPRVTTRSVKSIADELFPRKPFAAILLTDPRAFRPQCKFMCILCVPAYRGRAATGVMDPGRPIPIGFAIALITGRSYDGYSLIQPEIFGIGNVPLN